MKLKTLSLAMMSVAVSGAAIAADEIATMQANPNNWVSAAGNYNNQRYSTLDQITKDNVNDLKMAWSFSTGILRGHMKSCLLCVVTLLTAA